jgi:putative ubiquitin-RnfH superfamily antitoxin RatB of RatAB toxin-antitoxin module
MTAQHFSVTVAYATPDAEALVVVTLSAGATVDDAIARSGIVARLKLDPAQLEPAVFGQRVKGDTPLAPGDRVELTRPLVADPKRVRRKRASDPPRAKAGSRHTLRK